MSFTTSWFTSLLRAKRQETRRQNSFNNQSADHAGWYRFDQLEDRTLLSGTTDLEITKESPVTAVEQGAALTYTVIVSNIGAEGVTGVTVSDDYGSFLESVSWTAVVSGGASGNTSGTGILSELVDLPAGSSIEYTIAGTVKDDVRDNITNVATVDMSTYTDTDPTNNSAFDSDLIVLAAEGGTGVFNAGQSFTGADQTYSSTLGDIDGDGDLDVVFGNRGSAGQVWKNNGDGTFTNTGQSLAAGAGAELGDLDGDGDLDLFFARGFSSNAPDQVWLNDGSGTFTNSGQALGNDTGRFVKLGDIDGDGDLDALTSNGSDTNTIRVWLNNGSAVFTDSGQAISIAGSNHWGLALGDLDGDGDLDLFATTYGGNDAVFLNDGSGTFSLHQTVTITNANTLRLSLGDVDGDGDLDAAVSQPGGNTKLLLNDGTGIFTLGQELNDGINSNWAADFGDFDNDGDLDLLLSKESNQPNTLWLNDGNGNFTDSGQRIGSRSTIGVGIGDLDGDGDLDYVSANFTEANRVWLNEVTLPYNQDFEFDHTLGLVLNNPSNFSFVDDGGNNLLQANNSGFSGLSTAVLEIDALPS
ncbi:MAG: DUF11 domain-containing protein, partial [Planctomycetaceae bacterium]|nr:DUF11 domain-containing protein [Planctomycetaceae bacterium]